MELRQLIIVFLACVKSFGNDAVGQCFRKYYLNLESCVRHFSHTDCIKLLNVTNVFLKASTWLASFSTLQFRLLKSSRELLYF